MQKLAFFISALFVFGLARKRIDCSSLNADLTVELNSNAVQSKKILEEILPISEPSQTVDNSLNVDILLSLETTTESINIVYAELELNLIDSDKKITTITHANDGLVGKDLKSGFSLPQNHSSSKLLIFLSIKNKVIH